MLYVGRKRLEHGWPPLDKRSPRAQLSDRDCTYVEQDEFAENVVGGWAAGSALPRRVAPLVGGVCEGAEERVVHLELEQLGLCDESAELQVPQDGAPPQEPAVDGLVALRPCLELLDGAEWACGRGLEIRVPGEGVVVLERDLGDC